MRTYPVNVVRTVTTTLYVEAESAADARRKVEDYGIAEAWSDFEATDEQDTFRVKSVGKAQ